MLGIEKIKSVYLEKEQFLKKKYNRSLPFQDAIFDRWERAERLGFGKEASIYNSAFVFGNVSVGEHTWVGPNVILDGSGGSITIGSYCSISAGVHIYTHDSVKWALSGGRHPGNEAPVSIGNNTYIGAQSIFRAGVKVGNRCVVGANTFVNKDIPDNSVVAGVPGRVIGRVMVQPDGEIEIIYFSKRNNSNNSRNYSE